LGPSTTSTSGRAVDREPEIEGHRHDEDDPRGFDEGGRRRGAVVLQSGIGREGDFVERRHEFRDEDLGEEQAGRIDTQPVRVEQPAGDEHIGLALQEPEDLAGRHYPAITRDVARAAEVEARPHQCIRRPGHPDRAHREQGDRCGDQGPHAQSRPCPGQRGHRAGDPRGEIDLGLFAEIHLAREQCIGKGDERRRDVEQSLHAQQVGDHRLAIIGCGIGRAAQLDRREHQVEQDQHPEQLALGVPAGVAALDQRAGETIAVEHVEQDQDDLRHREQPVIRRA
jgi:hypothetical protein